MRSDTFLIREQIRHLGDEKYPIIKCVNGRNAVILCGLTIEPDCSKILASWLDGVVPVISLTAADIRPVWKRIQSQVRR